MSEVKMIRKLYMKILMLTLVLVVLFAAGSAFAQDKPPTDDEVNAIANGLYCPVCENIPLDVCPTQACEQWRATIREKLAIGWDEAQIKQYFVDQYGARVLATPPAQGLNWLVYILPPIAFLAGALVLWRAVKSWRIQAPEATLEMEAFDDPYLTRIEEELQRRERGEA
jgi:cytochrome c-type biogenesis protein CcmH